MTPKEKAFELVNKIFNEQHVDDRAKLITISSKKIAIMCVEEIINAEPTAPRSKKSYDELNDLTKDVYDYWQSVKSEIEKL